LTYRVPELLSHTIDVGYRVEVPLGRRRTHGFVVKTGVSCPKSSDGIDLVLKSIVQGKENQRGFDRSQLEFFEWVAEYYGDSLSSVIDVAVPPIAPPKPEKFLRVLQPQSPSITGKAQRALLKALVDAGGVESYRTIQQRFRGASATCKALLAAGAIILEERESNRWMLTASPLPEWAKRDVVLNGAQEVAVAEIKAAALRGEFKTFLLHGVTGSGKTEVYIEAIRATIAAGKGALIVVPEIALTPQLVDRFRVRLGDGIAVLHSGLNRGIRWDSWRALLEGRSAVAIGARSAIFAPVANLGIIVVDEEHDGSYKQNEGLRYNARDLAVLRGKFHSCPVVLGSATPSLESFHNAAAKRYRYIQLPLSHSTAAANRIEIVDLNRIKAWEMISKNISPIFHHELAAAVARDEQAFVLYNRRGFASYLQCEVCEKTLGCPNCSVTYTYHQQNNALVCHYCGLTSVPPIACPQCPEGNTPGSLVHRGAGTERVMEEIRQLFPHVAVERLDRDAVTTIDEYRAVLDRVRKGETRILVGTQMIAKGHDLPNVTFVGVVDCDVGLHMPDFRAGERIFQLLTQVAGRAGRAEKPGVVVLQTHVPQHPTLLRTRDRDFTAFAEAELRSRKELRYPPFTKMLRVIALAPEKDLALQHLRRLRSVAQSLIDGEALDVTILGPTTCPLSKLRAQWRAHLLLKSARSTTLLKVLHRLSVESSGSTKIRTTFDMDPQDML
jgi:primosomal protein N' (replication factor Y)